MNGINCDRNAYTDNGLNRPVIHMDVGIDIFNVIHGNTEKNNCGKERILRYAHEDGGIDNKSGKDPKKQIEDHGGPEAPSDRQQLSKEDHRSPEGTDQSAYNAFSSFTDHVGRVGLHTLKRRDDRIEGLAVHPPDDIDQHAEPYCDDRAHDPLTGRNDPGPRRP